MSNTILKRAAGFSVLLILFSISALAQTTQIEGTVKVKDKDGGPPKPVEGALIDIYRTDIKGHWDVKTDKKGHYIRLGMPVTGVYLLIVSGPGMAPTWLNSARLLNGTPFDFVGDPGDGSKLTQEQVQTLMSQQAKGGGGAGASTAPAVSASDKAKMEAQEKELNEKRKEAESLQNSYNEALAHYKQGVELMKTNFLGAVSEFEAASKVDPTKHEAFAEVAYKSYANLAEAHYQIGVDLFNNKKRDEAKTHFQDAVKAIDRSIAILATQPAEKNPNLNNDLITYYNIRAKNALLLIEHFGAADIVDDTIKMIEKVEAMDSLNKNKWAVMKGDAYRFSGRSDDAIAAYKGAIAADAGNVDALYGLGLTLIAGTEKDKIQEGANALADFVSKAPPTDKRVPDVKAALDAVKEAYKVEAEKPAKRRGKP